MRLGSFLVGACALLVMGFLGFRILDLEQQVASLSEQVNRKQSAGPVLTSAAPSKQSLSSVPNYAERLSALEEQVEALMQAKRSTQIGSTGDLGFDTLKHEEAILSLVERENSRIRDVQLEWHKQRWLETRQQQLAAFAYQHQLTPDQTSALYSALESELDSMVSVLKRPGTAEDPDQMASDWNAILKQTNELAAQVLTPEQLLVWNQARFFERRTVWPWLPQETTAIK